MRTILTPCIKKCEIDSTTSYCIGCGRTIQQLREWRIYTDDQRIMIINQIRDKRYGLGCTYRSTDRDS
jgi:predicted Fe-S protein YdhL (DUF1289 family)